MLFACSFCTSVASPTWWRADVLPRWHLPFSAVPLIGVALLMALWALKRLTGRRRIGVLLFALGLGVGLPAAALTVNSATRYFEVASTQKPMDGPVWNVRCDSAFQANPMDNDLSRDTTAGCSRATRPWRWAAIAMALASTLMLAAGGVLAVRGNDSDPELEQAKSASPSSV